MSDRHARAAWCADLQSSWLLSVARSHPPPPSVTSPMTGRGSAEGIYVPRRGCLRGTTCTIERVGFSVLLIVGGNGVGRTLEARVSR